MVLQDMRFSSLISSRVSDRYRSQWYARLLGYCQSLTLTMISLTIYQSQHNYCLMINGMNVLKEHIHTDDSAHSGHDQHLKCILVRHGVRSLCVHLRFSNQQCSDSIALKFKYSDKNFGWSSALELLSKWVWTETSSLYVLIYV